jgi:biopolymer transport protein TolQ
MNDFMRFVLNTGTVAKTVLVILAVLSVVSWAVIFEKIGRLVKVGRESKRFMRLFKERAGWNSLYNTSRSFNYSPFPYVFKKGYSEFYAWKKRLEVEEEPSQEMAANPGGVYPTTLPQIMESAGAESMSRLGNRLSLLAITVSVSPFLGLFGTVWGVMGAFMSIGMRGSADISTVGPGIAEALITTVVGLAVAIPALVGYNLIISRLRKMEDEIAVFSTDLVRLFEREKVQ